MALFDSLFEFLQKCKFYQNIAFKFYTKSYFLGNSFEAFSKNILK